MRSETPLRLDRRKVLNVIARDPPQVLNEAIHELAEVDRVAGRAPIVVRVRINRRPVRPHPPIAVTRQRQEHRRPKHLATRSRVDPPERRLLDPPLRQVRRILAPTSRAHAPSFCSRIDVAPHARSRQRRIDLANRFVPLRRVLTGSGRSVSPGRQVGPHLRQATLFPVRLVRLEYGFCLAVPSLTALRHPQPLLADRTRPTDRRHRAATRHVDDDRFARFYFYWSDHH